jgi:16S rRNA (guanine(966)-N(2))-methyltransferase RsmD
LSNPRIIAGKARGHRLKDVPGDITRPITDRVKEALFNILGADVVGSTWLDLFAGTGSVGLEALSRGAEYVRFNDLNRAAIDTIKANVEATGLQAGAEIGKSDAFALLGGEPKRSFDYIYVAPPQYKELWTRAMDRLEEKPAWLNQDGWVLVQIDPVEYQPPRWPHFNEFDQRKYGSTLLVFYEFAKAA